MVISVNFDSQANESQDYDIVLERGVLSRAAEHINLARKVLVVTDSGVPAKYSEIVSAQCQTPVIVTIPQGEASKNMEQFQALLAALLQAGFSRKDCVVAVGGGVVGDLSGFAAACYMRGLDFYNLPTTLLSQVDSSIGGKTAIDFHGVKNIVGAFYQPKKVLIDTDTLATLDDRQLHAGLAEAIKMAATFDAELFALIEKSSSLNDDLDEIIRRSLVIKKNVVAQDPKETGLRKVLNFGHTIGHAVESAENGRLLHGECVALGMLPFSSEEPRARIKNLLQKYGLPVTTQKTREELLPFVLHDKKKAESKITAVLVEEIGSFKFQDLSAEEILECLKNLCG